MNWMREHRIPMTVRIRSTCCSQSETHLLTEAWPEWVATLQSLQDPESGLFEEATHHPIHVTAHCLAALHLLGAKAAHPLKALAEYKTPQGVHNLLEGLDWKESPWRASHQGAGVYAALVLNGEVGEDWQQAYFEWVLDHVDPVSEFLHRDHVRKFQCRDSFGRFPHLAGTFHYLFNMEYRRVPLPYPAQMIDTCLEIWRDREYPIGESVGFAEIDWVYCLTRERAQCGHRWQEVHEALTEMCDRYVAYLFSLDPERSEQLNDLHMLFGAVCALAELQRALPGKLHSCKPLHLVLDRRPFI